MSNKRHGQAEAERLARARRAKEDEWREQLTRLIDHFLAEAQQAAARAAVALGGSRPLAAARHLERVMGRLHTARGIMRDQLHDKFDPD